MSASYTERVREEIASALPRQNKQRRALLCGILFDAEREGGCISCFTASEYAVSVGCELLRTLYNNEPEMNTISLAGKKYYSVEIKSEKLSLLLEQGESDMLSAYGENDILPYFLRGLFLSFGTVNSPEEKTHVEFLLSQRERAERLSDFFEAVSLPHPGITARRKKTGLYYKSNDKLCDLLGGMALTTIMFSYLNSSALRSIEAGERRATNCISGNISRSVEANARQLADCAYMLDPEREVFLGDSGLRTTALLRVQNPDMTLGELSALHIPPITKSGLNHRFVKISELARKYGKKSD